MNKAELTLEVASLNRRLVQARARVVREERKSAKANESLREFRRGYDQLAMTYRIAQHRLDCGEGNARRAELAEEKLRLVREIIGIGGHVLSDDDRTTFHDFKDEFRPGHRYLPIQKGTVPQ